MQELHVIPSIDIRDAFREPLRGRVTYTRSVELSNDLLKDVSSSLLGKPAILILYPGTERYGDCCNYQLSFSRPRSTSG